MEPDIQQIKDILSKLCMPCLLVDDSRNVIYASTAFGHKDDPAVLRNYQRIFRPVLSRLPSFSVSQEKDGDGAICFEVDPQVLGVGPFLRCTFVPIADSDEKVYSLLYFSDVTCSTILEQLPIVSFYSLHSDILNIQYATPVLERWTGIALEKFINNDDTYRLLIHPEDRRRVISFVENFYGTSPDNPSTISYRLTHANGSYRWIEHKIIVSICAEGGKACFSMLRDITAQKELEFTLSGSEERCQLFFEKGPLGFLCIDRTGVIVDCNNQIADLIGVKRDDLLGLNALSSASPTFRDWAREVLRGNEIKFTGKYVTALTERELFVSLLAFPLKNDEGVVIGAYALVEDLRSRKELEEKLVAQRDFNKLIIETAEVLVAEILPDSTIFQVNTVFADLLGRSHVELLGTQFTSLMVSCSPEISRIMAAASSGQREEASFESYVMDWKGSKRLISWKVSPYSSSNDSCEEHYLVVGTDITSQRQLQEKLREVQKMEAIGRLAGGVAHDFNNQLTAIMGYCQMLLMEVEQKSEQYRKLKIINKAAQRASETTNQLLAFSRKQTLKPERVSLNKAVKEACNFFERLLGEEIDVKFIPGKSDCIIEVDPGRFLQIFLNLALNSRDAMEGRGTITVSTRVSRSKKVLEHLKGESGRAAVITFEDDGCGMEKEVMEKAFEPFFTTKPLGQGTGLGLAMIYGTLKQSGGDISIHSISGKGTKVTIFLPAFKSTGRYKTSIKNIEVERQVKGRRRLVFLLEDEQIVRSTVVEYLKKLDFRVKYFSSPSELDEFLSTYNGPQPYLFISDVVMPQKDGFDMVRKVKEAFPDVRSVLMSGYSAQVLAKKGQISKVGAFIQKPFTVREFKEILHRVMK